MKKKTFYTVLFWILVLIAVGAVGYIVYNFSLRFFMVHTYEELREQAFIEEALKEEESVIQTVTNTPSNESTEKDTEDEDKTQEVKESWHPGDTPYTSPLNFDYLQKINEDIYAWIMIPGFEEISYPILQHPTEDWHYQVYSFDEGKNNTGAIYTHGSSNNKDFNDFNTIVYGHNLIAGGMFTDLENYWDQDFSDEHRTIVIYTPDRALYYTVFAVVAYGDQLLNYTCQLEDAEDRQAYIDSVYGVHDLRSHTYGDIEVTPEDHLLTISTCMGSAHRRLLIVSVLTDVRE